MNSGSGTDQQHRHVTPERYKYEITTNLLNVCVSWQRLTLKFRTIEEIVVVSKRDFEKVLELRLTLRLVNLTKESKE